jgi:hypothetical protein
VNAPLARHAYPPPWEALGDLLHFGGKQGFRLPPRAGGDAPWPPGERELLDLLVACVRADGATARALLPALDARGDWLTDRWWAGAAAFLWARLGALGLHDDVPASLRAPLLAEERVCRGRHAHALRHVPALAARLERDGLLPVLLKGLAYATWLYPEPWTRPAGDVDLLLRPDEAARAERLLLADGYVPTPLHGGARGGTHRHGAPLARRLDDVLLVVELHTSLADRAAPARLGGDELLARSEWMELGGRGVRVLAADDRLAHIGLHHPAELTWRRVLDVLLAGRRMGASGFSRARRLLDPAERWQVDLLALLAARLLDPGLERAVPAGRGGLLALACAADWPRAHLSALRTGNDGAAQGGRVRRPLRAALDRLDELGRAALPVLAREQRRRTLALARLVRDVARAAAGRSFSA